MAGYSGTPLVKKLGLKPFMRIVAIGTPKPYLQLLGDPPDGIVVTERAQKGSSFVHLFATRRAALASELRKLRNLIAADGVVWVSWPKKTSHVDSDVTEDIIREIALPLDFVDIKVCAVDDTWSGLKLMIRREKR